MRRNLWSGHVMRGSLLALLVGTTAGCIQVKAPDKPIEINLNIKIEQQITILRQDAKSLIDNNPELFPQ